MRYSAGQHQVEPLYTFLIGAAALSIDKVDIFNLQIYSYVNRILRAEMFLQNALHLLPLALFGFWWSVSCAANPLGPILPTTLSVLNPNLSSVDALNSSSVSRGPK